MTLPRRIVVHGHFYQPPREEPWLELVPREPTAAPDHDWNARITRECYAPLAAARVLDPHGRIRRLINAYAWCSFDVGPTLFRWMDRHAPEVVAAIVAGDAASRARLGVGNAMAQPYHHVILPLASRRDKVTEVRWGIRDFRRRFGREPEGMWLPETAVDHETLEVLAEEGIRFTVLAPHQVTHPPAHGRPGWWRGGGRELAIFCHDGPLAHDIAFGDLLRDGATWHARLAAAPLAEEGITVTAMATDGETFGHHHADGERALASLIDGVEHDGDAVLTNFGAVLAAHPRGDDVTLVERTAWSCPHQLGRWERDCGCRMEGGTSQAWRAPLRLGLQRLADTVHEVVERAWPAAIGDVWTIRDAAGPELDEAGSLTVEARRLLEAERHALAMFTSCGWFFDDLARIEPRIILRHAARAIEGLPADLRDGAEAALLEVLGTAASNDPAEGDGITIWKRDVLAPRDGEARLAAGIAALRDVVPDALDDLALPAHDHRLDGEEIVTIHRRTGEEHRWRAETVVAGIVPTRIHLRRLDDLARPALVVTVAELPAPVRDLLLAAVRPMVFDAALDDAARERLRDGALAPADAMIEALDGAWRLTARDGLDDAAVVVHAALDLFDLTESPLPASLRAQAFATLSALAPSSARTALGGRFGVVLPEAG